MKLYKKEGKRYHEASNGEVVLAALNIIAENGGKEIVDLFTLNTMQGKIEIKEDIHE